MRKLIDVKFKPGGLCPIGPPKEDPGGRLLPSVQFDFDDNTMTVYPAKFFEDDKILDAMTVLAQVMRAGQVFKDELDAEDSRTK